MKVTHVPKESMDADCMTKALSGPSLLKNVNNFMCAKIYGTKGEIVVVVTIDSYVLWSRYT